MDKNLKWTSPVSEYQLMILRKRGRKMKHLPANSSLDSCSFFLARAFATEPNGEDCKWRDRNKRTGNHQGPKPHFLWYRESSNGFVHRTVEHQLFSRTIGQANWNLIPFWMVLATPSQHGRRDGVVTVSLRSVSGFVTVLRDEIVTRPWCNSTPYGPWSHLPWYTVSFNDQSHKSGNEPFAPTSWETCGQSKMEIENCYFGWVRYFSSTLEKYGRKSVGMDGLRFFPMEKHPISTAYLT